MSRISPASPPARPSRSPFAPSGPISLPATRCPPGENALPGTVEDVVYQGEMMRVRVAIADGSSLVVAVRNEGQLTRPLEWKRGDPVAVGWRPEDSQLLEEG